MVVQFTSFKDPLIVLLTLPLGFIGVAATLLATGTNLSIMSFMGIIMVVGIVVEYSNALIDFANRRLLSGAANSLPLAPRSPIRHLLLPASRGLRCQSGEAACPVPISVFFPKK